MDWTFWSSHNMLYRMICLTLILIGCFYYGSASQINQNPPFLNIAVLTEDSYMHRLYFNFAVNQSNTELAKTSFGFRFRALFRIVKNINQVLTAVCDLVKFRDDESRPGIIAVFAPKDSLYAAVVQDFGDSFSIPVFHYSQSYQLESQARSLFVNLHPHFSTVKFLLRNVTSVYNWTKFAILYENEDSFRSLELVMRVEGNDTQIVRAFKLGDGAQLVRQSGDQKRKSGGNDLPSGLAAKSLKQLRSSQLNNVLVQTSQADLRPLLDKMQKMQMLTSKYHYIFNNFHTGDYDLSQYLEGEVNLTAFRIGDRSTEEFRRVESSLKWVLTNPSYSRLLPKDFDFENPVTFDFALILDSFKLIRLGLTEMLSATTLHSDPELIECRSKFYWTQGHTFINYIRLASARTVGLTGPLRVNGFGERLTYEVEIAQRVADDMQIVGNWSLQNGTNLTVTEPKDTYIELLNNKTLRVTTIIQPPFTMLKPPDKDKNKPKKSKDDDEKDEDGETKPVDPNDQFEGYCIDLLEEMKKYMLQDGINFQYQISLVKDGNYGSEQEDGDWNGMVGELQRGEADLAVAPLTINYQRQDDIDFSTPFMNLGISILFRRRENRTPSIFSFLMPLHMNIWMYLIVSYISISTVLFVLSRFTPFERDLPEDPSVPKLTLSNSFWFSAGAMMQQGSEIVPMATSTRIVSVGWYIFTLIIFCSYTANLAAFLTVTRMESPIQDVEELAQQSQIKYGTLRSSSTYVFFQNSGLPTYVRMFQFMERYSPKSYVDSTETGIKRVLEDDYAFLMESTMLEYQVSQICNLTQVGGLLDSKFYGIGLRKDSPYTEYVSKAILQLQDDGVLVKLKKKWWEERGKCNHAQSGGVSMIMNRVLQNCTRDLASCWEDASALKMDSIGGIFYVLIGGTATGLLAALVEFCWKTRRNAADNKTSMWSEAKSFMKRSYRKDEMIFGSMASIFEKESDDDGKPAGGSEESTRIPEIPGGSPSSLSLYTNSKASPGGVVLSPTGSGHPLRPQFYPPQTFQAPPGGVVPVEPTRFGTLPIQSTHSIIDDVPRRGGNSANSTLKSSFNSSSNNGQPRTGLKLRFSPTVDKQVYCQEHSSDQLSLNQSANNSNIQNSSAVSNGSMKAEAGTQTKNVRIKTDTDV
ncbi:glutamate receptor ionotropic, kainate 2-like isoform X2 [Convolutriloba macropyga]|uniref:glutamate receptor ionotropic, kainate 2-like isoform X2 n=1 Tax=Convolutriloba macropyga TaxID=536237 RepID=UPI003F521AC6